MGENVQNGIAIGCEACNEFISIGVADPLAVLLNHLDENCGEFGTQEWIRARKHCARVTLTPAELTALRLERIRRGRVPR